MNIEDFDYFLPENLIAQEPAKERDLSRLLVLERDSGSVEHRLFKDIIAYFREGDCIVLNDTRVFPARLFGRRIDTGGKIEFLLLRETGNGCWEVILKPGRKARVGSRFVFGPNNELEAEVVSICRQGNRIVKFSYEGDFRQILASVGIIPLPPYIKKPPADYERYQTVYSKAEGSAAAPTAGLHFTENLLDRIRTKGIATAYVTLHVGIGTFQPVKEHDITRHTMHEEYYSMTTETAALINKTRERGGRVFAVGTTSCRVLETLADRDGYVSEGSGWTDIFIYPGYKFKTVDALITNFHLPRSTLIMLVCAFAGKNALMSAYNEAIERQYRFYSFGDAMLII